MGISRVVSAKCSEKISLVNIMLGSAGGPLLVGRISGVFGDDLKVGILAALVFPVLLILGVLAAGKKGKEARQECAAPDAG